jgi:hypothetical protein
MLSDLTTLVHQNVTKLLLSSVSMVALLFSASEPGQLMPVDPAYLYQDTAGTTPVTATGQAVALQLDQSKGLVLGPELVTNGTFDTGISGWSSGLGSPTLSWVPSNAMRITRTVAPVNYSVVSQTISGLTVGKRYNVTSTFNNVGSGTNPYLAINGVAVGTDRLSFVATATSHTLEVNTTTGAIGTSFDVDNISVKELPGNHDTQPTVGSRPIYGKHPANGYRNMLAASDALSTQSVTVTAIAHTLSFTGTGTVTLSGASTSGPLVGTGASNRVSLTFTPTAGTLTLTVSGSVTLAQLETGSTATTYQRTGATSGVAWPAPPSYDITEAGQPDLHYLHYNGVSSFMVSPTITPGIDKAQVFVGVRKLSDAAGAGILVELSTGIGTNNGSLTVAAPLNAVGQTFSFGSKGTIFTAWSVPSSGYAAQVSAVVSGIGDIAGDVQTLRLDGSVANARTDDQGTGNYLAYPIYTGRRGGTSLPFNGLVYSKIVRFGANLTADQIASTERWTAQRTGVAI